MIECGVFKALLIDSGLFGREGVLIKNKAQYHFCKLNFLLRFYNYFNFPNTISKHGIDHNFLKLIWELFESRERLTHIIYLWKFLVLLGNLSVCGSCYHKFILTGKCIQNYFYFYSIIFMRIFTRSNFMKHLYKTEIKYSHYCFDKICAVEIWIFRKKVFFLTVMNRPYTSYFFS